MWTVIYMAYDKKTADKVKRAIEDEGFLVKTRQISSGRRQDYCVELAVPETEAQDASRVIYEQNL